MEIVSVECPWRGGRFTHLPHVELKTPPDSNVIFLIVFPVGDAIKVPTIAGHEEAP
jgi:hypothetical protein